MFQNSGSMEPIMGRAPGIDNTVPRGVINLYFLYVINKPWCRWMIACLDLQFSWIALRGPVWCQCSTCHFLLGLQGMANCLNFYTPPALSTKDFFALQPFPFFCNRICLQVSALPVKCRGLIFQYKCRICQRHQNKRSQACHIQWPRTWSVATQIRGSGSS